MRGGSGRQAKLARELVEWREDLWQRGTTSRVVLVAVPPRWGRTTVLDSSRSTFTAVTSSSTVRCRPRPGLDAFYRRNGFQVLSEGESLDLWPIFGVHSRIDAGQGERFFIGTPSAEPGPQGGACAVAGVTQDDVTVRGKGQSGSQRLAGC
jgi:hypothetical protein